MSDQIRLLLADDHAVVRSGLRMLLQAQPDMIIVGEAETGQEAIRRVAELSPDVVLMDINLPGMSGLDALRILKADPVTAAIPVIAVSAAAMPRDIQSGLDAGFRDYLTKPFDVQALLSRIREILQDSRR